MSHARWTATMGLLACPQLAERPAASQQETSGPEVGYPLEFNVSRPVREMPPQAHYSGSPKEIPMHRPPARTRSGSVSDPVVQTSTPQPAVAQGLSSGRVWAAGTRGFPLRRCHLTPTWWSDPTISCSG
jgi:hypothetical protein